MVKQFYNALRRQIKLMRVVHLIFLEKYGKKDKSVNKSKKIRRRRPRNVDGYIRHKDFEACEWFQRINDPEVEDPNSATAKKFRTRFRVPFPLFRLLLQIAQDLGFELRPKSACNIPGIPLELKMLGVLRVLGRGTCFDGIEELALGDKETFRVFFHDFNEKFVKNYYSMFVHTPSTEDEIKEVMTTYEKLGFPGAIGKISSFIIIKPY